MNNIVTREDKNNTFSQDSDFSAINNAAELRAKEISKSYILFKRLFDLLISGVGIVVLFPLFLLIIIAIRLDSPGKATFFHPRLGMKGKKIKLYKFRTMVINADEVFESFTPEQKAEFEREFKLENDPRITRIGKLLRNTSLDELPQLLNIIKGDLSLVGPRPVVEREIYKYGDKSEKFLLVKPGLTGYWQANGRSNTTYEQRIEMDMFYIDNCSLLLDLKIIGQTIISVFRRDGAI